ncbi:MAG: type I secretion system permease/ATPase [Synergistaceae bacterium]|jgi:subfamily B ATP-binding cassette protein HlyB/CyaB|nr:type I secretion system permease/ATPase [Synergistaceae bacterium]
MDDENGIAEDRENTEQSGEAGPSGSASLSEPSKVEAALACLVAAAHISGIPADHEGLCRAFPSRKVEELSLILLRAAKKIGLKAKHVNTTLDRLDRLPQPSLLLFPDGEVLVLIRSESNIPAHESEEEEVKDAAKKGKIMLYHPREKRPFVWSFDQLEERRWEGEAIPLAKRFSFAELSKKFGIGWFLPVILRFRKHLSEVFIGSFFLQTFGLITPLFSQVIIDKVLVHKGLSTLDILVLGLVIINVFEMILTVTRTYLFSHTTNRVDVILGAKLFHHLLALPLPYFEARTVGTTIARVRELESIRSFITGTALTVVLDMIFTVVFIAVMFWYSAKLTLISLAAMPFFVALSVIVTPILRERLNKKFACNAESQSYLVEMVSGIQTVKSLAIEPQLNHRWEGLLANYVRASFRSGFLGSVAGSTAHLIQKSASLAILWFGARMVMEGDFTVGQLIAFQMLSGRVTEPILRLATLWQDFQQARLSIERLGDVLNFPPEPDSSPGRSSLGRINGKVEFDHIGFRYRLDGPPVLDDISITVEPGSTVGIVGRSGSGKSTLTKLIQRFYMPAQGRVLVDGTDLSQVDPVWLRRQIGVVLQENFLFNGSVRDNIAIVDTAASLEKVIAAAKLAGAHDFILELPDGYDAPVGERGASLSGGQRQRIAIARTLMTDPRILIFDEATSALDYESERIIQKNLRGICKGRTVFIIAHRLSTVRASDFIIAMDKGRIVERGTHDELLKLGGLYSFLHRQQEMLGDLDDAQ